jgi:hypothetical protein
MASIKISNLPAITPGILTDDDQFVVNDANQTTSRLSYGNLKSRFLGENHTFSGSVNFSGDVNVNVNSTNTNVLTIESATVLINESEARSGVLIQENADDISRLVSLTKAPSDGGIYLSGTFTGAADSATNLVDAINDVAGDQVSNGNRITVLEGLVNTNTSGIAANTTSISDLDSRVGTITTTVGELETEVSAIQNELSTLSGVVGDNTAGLVYDITALGATVTDLQSDVADIQTTLAAGGDIKNEIEAAKTAADEAQTFAESNNAEYRTILAEAAAEIVTETAAAVGAGTLDAASLSAIITDALGAALAANNHSGI